MSTRAAAIALTAAAVTVGGCGSAAKHSRSTPAPAGAAAAQDFHVTLPAGWADRTAATRSGPFNLLAAYVTRPTNPQRAIVTVVRESPPAGIDVDRLARLEVKTAASQTRRTHQTPLRSAEVAGEPARGYEYLTHSPSGRPLRQGQLFTLHNGRAYTITLTASPRGFAAAKKPFAAILGSWRWA